jgi:hypothetical protein
MTASLTRHRTRDALTLDQAKTELRNLGYEIRDQFPTSPGTCIALLDGGGWHVTVVLAEHQVHAHQIVLLSRTAAGRPNRLVCFVDSQVVNHERQPLDVSHAVAAARKFASNVAHATELAAGTARWAVTR